MPPLRAKRDHNAVATASQEVSSRTVAIQSPATPERTSTQRAPAVTAAQKQALIDNIQLEITERARKLRAQYALHAQGLRSRLEMRINRIPQSLRSTNIEELINKYSEQLEAPIRKPFPLSKTTSTTASKLIARSKAPTTHSASPARMRGTKRTSSEMAGGSDKENIHIDLELPKKRTKAATVVVPQSSAGTRGTRTTSRKIDPSKVLSPKSHNSRTLPQSPFKAPVSPGKSYLARPVSPAKPTSSVAVATASLASMIAPVEKPKSTGRAGGRQAQAVSAASTTSAGSVRGRRGAAAAAMAPPPVPPKTGRGRAASSSSHNSDTSNGTTIVTKKTAPARKGIMGKVTGMATSAGRRAAAKKEIAAPSAQGNGGRVLRARR